MRTIYSYMTLWIPPIISCFPPSVLFSTVLRRLFWGRSWITVNSCVTLHWTSINFWCSHRKAVYGKLSEHIHLYWFWRLFGRASSSWNNVKCQLDTIRCFYWCILSSTCVRYIRPSSGALDVELQHVVFCAEFLDGWWSWEPLRRSCVRCWWCCATLPSAPYTRPMQRLSRPPPIQKPRAENHMLQLNIQCSWWWAYVPDTCRAKKISIKTPYCFKLAFHII